jgi:hypothetical protein
MTTSFGHYVTYWQPLKPVQFWNRSLKLWVSRRTEDCLYTSAHGAAVGAAHVRQRYSDSEIHRLIRVDYLTQDDEQEA